MRSVLLARLVNPSWTVSWPALEKSVRGQIILVTGASYGLGEATARGLGRAGARVLLVARSADKLEAVARDIRGQGGHAQTHPCDLSDPIAVGELVERLLATYGHVDVLISNAGKSMRRSVVLQTDRYHDFTRTMGINFFGPVRLILALLPSMREHGGHIVNISTIGVRMFPGPRWGAYQASKGALDVWLRSITPEIRPAGIVVSTVYMSLIQTRMSEPTPAMRRLPGLTPDQAARLVFRAIIEQPRAIAPWWAGLVELLSVLTRGVQQPFLTRAFTHTHDTPSALAAVTVKGEVNSALRVGGLGPSSRRGRGA